MAALAQNWQSLLNIRPTDIHVENQVEDEKNEQLGELYIKLNADELDNIDDLRHALRLGQRFTDLFREQKVEYWETLVKLGQENEKLKKISIANAKDADTFLKDEISDRDRQIGHLQNQVEEYKKQYENEFGELGQIRDELKKSEAKVRELQNQRDNFRKISEDLQKRLEAMKDPSRVKPDDVERTQRVRAVEKELSELLDENNNFFEDNQKLRKDVIDLQRGRKEDADHIKKLSTDYKHKTADTFLKDQISDLQRLLVLTENQADEYKKQYEHEFDEVGRIRDKLKKSEVKVRELQNQRDDFRKRSEDLQKRVVELLGSSRVKPNDVERTQRIRAVEKELSKLLDENNNFFEENQHLRKDLTDLRREKEEVGAHIKKLSTGYKHNIELLNEKEQENQELRQRINLLESQNVMVSGDDDDVIMKAVEDRVKQWKDVFKAKDDEIDDLKRKLISLHDKLQIYSMDDQKADVTALNKAVAEKDQQILMLRKKVEEATNDLIKQTDALDRMRSDYTASNDPTAIANRSHVLETSRLKKQVNDYEKELAERDIRLHDLDKQLKAFLDNNYELRDAVHEIRQLKEQLKLKDRQIEDLAQYASRNELTVHEVTDENEELRAKLGMDPRTPMTVEQLKTARMTRTEANQAVVQVLQKEEVTAQREMNKQLEEGLDKYRRKLNVIKHQTGLLYKDFHEKQQLWSSEREQTNEAKRDLQTEIEKNLVKLQEFDRLLNTLEQDDAEVRRRIAEVTRKITVLRVNEKELARKILSYQDIESKLRKDNTKLRTEVIDMEVAVQTRLNYLQRFKDTAAYRIKHLQKQVEESVHQTELDKLNKKYEDVVEKYRDLLEQQHTYIQQTEQTSIVSDANRRLTDEVEFLKRQLQIDKEKMHLLEETMENLKNQGLINSGYATTMLRTSTTGSLDDDNPGSLSRKITVLEMKELNERQRAEYAQKLYDQQRVTLRQMEDRNLELEHKFSQLTRMNLEMQRAERELRDELAYSVPRTVSDADKRRISELEGIEIQSKQEIARLREISEVATYQVGAINDMKVLDEKEFQSLRLQLLDLQSKSDDKSEIGKLHRHILALQISEATSKRKQLQSDNDLAKQKALLLRAEQKLDEKEQSLFFIRQEYTQRIRYLRTALQDYRHKYAGALPLRVQESYAKTMIDLRNGKKQLDLDMKKLADQKFDLETQIASYEFKHKSLEELLATLKDGQGNARVQKMIEWQQKLEKVKLNELRHIRLNKRLETDKAHLNKVVQQLEINVTELEEENVKFEKEIEERQLIWEHRELEMERKIDQLEKQQNDIADAAKRFEEAIGNYPDPSLPVAHQLEQALRIIRENIHLLMEAKVQHQLVEKRTAEHIEKVREMENAILARDKIIHELRLRLPTTTILDSDKLISDVMTRPDDFSRLAAVRAAQSTIDSLQARIIQKEESIRKYQEMLKEARDDLNKQTRQHEEELQLLNEQLQNKRDLDFIRFKEFVERGGNPAHFHGTPTSFELARVRELEENVAVQENTIAHLNEKLREARREAETWKARLTQKMEQFKHDRENVKTSYEKIVDQLNREIEHHRSQLQDQQARIGQMNEHENAQKSSPSKGTKDFTKTGANQPPLKEEKSQELIRVFADIRSDMVKMAKGNLKALNEEDKQSLSIPASITNKIAQLQEKIDDYEGQIQNLKRELKTQKALAQQSMDEAADARQKLGQNEKKLTKLQQQNAALTDNAQRRMAGQQFQQGQGEDTIESLRRQNRLLEDKLRKTKTAERPMDENRVSSDERTRRTVESLQQQVTDLDTHKKELLKFNQQLKEELSKVRLRNEELQKINVFLKAENESLRNGDSPRSTSSGGIRRIGESGRSTVELEKIIALMKKKIDHLQAENQTLKSDLDRQRATNDSNRAFFTQATESTKEIEHMGQTNSRLQKEVALLREQVAQLQMKALPRSPSSSNNGFH
ncbi:unnamed protein product [Rotaria sp. Silwood1]|nr:unnamed protein product [Rotaria sp. Silwood1]